jgi:hypothetical protein
VLDSQKLYELAIDGRVVVIRCLGDWDRRTGLGLFLELEELLGELEPNTPWASLVDFTLWTPSSADVVAMANDAKALLDGAGRAHGAFLIGSLEAAKMMIERSLIQPRAGRIQYFQTEAAAREWLASLGYLDQ